MLKIGVMGLGNIAQKAYLPVMAGMQNEYDWYLCTRNAAKGQMLGAKYGFKNVLQTVDELIAAGMDAVFVHTPTPTHPQILRKLLNAGINVHVDKPVATDVATVRALYALAKRKGVLLTCGFNRRFAPNNVALKQLPNKQMIVAEKDREHTLQDAEFAVWDLMIHSVDTALWLMDEPVQTQMARVLRNAQGELLQGYFTATGAHSEVQVVTNMDAHANNELVTVQAKDARMTSNDLLQLRVATAAGIQIKHRPDWEETLETRGFAVLIRAFLNAVSTGGDNPVSPQSALASHAACAAIVATFKDAY